MSQRKGNARKRLWPARPGRPPNDGEETIGRAPKRRGLGVALILAAAAALAMATPMAAAAAPPASHASAAVPCDISLQQVQNGARSHGVHVSGVIVAAGDSTCVSSSHKPTEPAFRGTPPLLFHPAVCPFAPCENGSVLMTPSTGPLVVVPIFWNPAGFPMSSGYKNLITTYLGGVAADSGHTHNVFSVADEYSGTNGQIHYNVQLGPVVNDTNPLPASGCMLNAADTTAIYADGSGYSACLDDAQLQAEVESIIGASGFPHGLTHIYVLYLPKGVESCFNPGSTTSTAGGQACTINHEPTAAFCAYHNEDPSSALYANLAYPIYHSATHFTCGSDAKIAGFGTIESPNGNPDADVEVSPTSHEINETITDPDTESGWYDSNGFENGDECNGIYGQTRGARGAFFNQVINGVPFLTQEEFSNDVFNASGGTAGCVQSQSAEH